MGKADLQKLNGVENGAVGIISGAIEVTILQPMLYCKNSTQQNLPLTLNPAVVYRGLFVSVTNMAILTGLQFPLTVAVRNAFTGGEKRALTNAEVVGSSFIGGALSGFVCGPMELVMVQQQRFGGSVISTPKRLMQQQGFSALGRGIVTSCGREGMFCAGYLGLGPTFAGELNKRYPENNAGLNKFIGSVSAGVIAATLSHPMDTIKTCMQGDVEQKRFTSLSGTAATLYRENGLSRFFSGWAWRTGRMICAIYIFAECQNRIPLLMFPSRFKDE